MNNIILFDHDYRDRLLPFTFTRPVADLRIGILTIREKWQLWMDGGVSFITQEYLSEKYPINLWDKNYVINGGVLPNARLCERIRALNLNEALMAGDELIAARMPIDQFEALMSGRDLGDLRGFPLEDSDFLQIRHLWDIFRFNDVALRSDFELLTRGRISQPIPPSNRVIEPENIFIEEGARVECSNINASLGPVYIGKYAEIMEGCSIRGPFALGDYSTLKMGAKVYGATTVGPHCKVGGEVSNVVFWGNSNKAHDGFLGNSVIGEWCNIGSGTEASNLKNNYDEVRVWDYSTDSFQRSSQQFAGLFMGDHSKCAIGTTFNTGTVVGVGCNIFGEGFPRQFIPSYTWGGKQGMKTYLWKDCVAAMDRVLARRDKYLKEEDRLILEEVFRADARYRTWEKNTEE